MSEFLANITPLMVFLIIATVGFIFLLISLVVGDVFDSLGFDLGIDNEGLLDSRVISVFVTAFGGFGAIGIQTGLGIAASSIVGLVGGVLLGGAVSLFGRFLHRQQATSSVSATQLIGRTAQVVVSITPGSLGQVSCRVGEERIERLARARDNQEIKAGSIVRVDEIAGDSLIVVPYNEGAPGQHSS